MNADDEKLHLVSSNAQPKYLERQALIISGQAMCKPSPVLRDRDTAKLLLDLYQDACNGKCRGLVVATVGTDGTLDMALAGSCMSNPVEGIGAAQSLVQTVTDWATRPDSYVY